MSLTRESVVVITGAASGIGRALAVRLSQENISGIAVSDVNEKGLGETVDLIKNPNLTVTAHHVNVADEAAMHVFVREVVKSHGRVTHLINNAGVALGGSIKEVSLEDMCWLMNINFWGVVYGTKLFLPFLEKEQSAHIINFSSLYGLIAPPGNATYAASKFAVRGFTEALRHELESTNISVSVVHPGGVKTNIANNAKIGQGVALTGKEIEERKIKQNQLLNRTTLEKAAEIIVKGIKARNPRILIGADAHLLSFLARIFPRSYFSVINLISGGRLKNN